MTVAAFWVKIVRHGSDNLYPKAAAAIFSVYWYILIFGPVIRTNTAGIVCRKRLRT